MNRRGTGTSAVAPGRRSTRSVALAFALAVGLPSGAATAVGTAASAAHQATLPGVTLLAPVGDGPSPSGAFDSSVDLRIEIFALASDIAIGSPVGPSFSVSNAVGQRIKVAGTEGSDPHYRANWRTSDSRRPDGSTVRVEIRLPSAPAGPACNPGVSLSGGCIGYFDVGLRKGKKGSWPAGFTIVRNGQALPIKVHIARGALDAPTEASQLSGSPGSDAADAIPDLRYEFNPDDYAPHPGLGGLTVSFRTMHLAFRLGTTVAQANALLSELRAEIVGGRPGKAGEAEGLLLIRVHAESHAQMDVLVDRLNADPRVRVAVQDSLLGTTEIPAVNNEPVGWFWQVVPEGDNWGPEAIRMPQLWNLNRALIKHGQETITGVLDGGFAHHPDLVYDRELSVGVGPEPQHGLHVVGTIAATYDNKIGVDGMNPFVDLVVKHYDDTGGWGLFDFIESAPDLDVVNLSLGHNWYKVGIDPALHSEARELVIREGAIFRLWQDTLLAHGRQLPLIVAGAGNDSFDVALWWVDVDAKWGSPWNYAALTGDADNVIVVEALELQNNGAMTRASFSNLNGHISAPGVDICSTASVAPRVPGVACGGMDATEAYRLMSGTSMAAPHVTGVAGYLLSLDPTLTPAEIRRLMVSTASPVGGGASPAVDAFASALAIDGLRNDASLLRRLLDLDDGTPDGNLRLDCSTACVVITTENADADNGKGDGMIDMSDFRRWRDWQLLIEDSPELLLDGAQKHPKNDVNQDGDADGATFENRYPDADFNGDGVLDRMAVRFVPGYINAPATDLEVLQALFDDPDYSASQLPGLIDSADIHVDPAGCMTDGVIGVRTKIIDADTDVWVDGRFDREGPMNHEYTMPITTGGYIVRVEAIDSNGNVAGVAQNSFRARLGSDTWYGPTCGRITLSPTKIDVTLNAGETTTRDVQLISSGLGADWAFGNPVAHVEPSPTGGSLAAGGETTIEVTITCPTIPRGYGGFLDLEFRDEGGNLIEQGVPESLPVDIVCLEGGVIAEPESFEVTLPVGESAVRTFRLTNKGTEMSYEAQPGDHITIQTGESGVLTKRGGQAFVTFEVTCPETVGTFATSVALTFERDDAKPVTVQVPEVVSVDLNCTGALHIVRQLHHTQVGAIFETKSESYWSYDEEGRAEIERFYARTRNVGDPLSLVKTPIPPIGFGDVSSITDLTASEELGGGWQDLRTVHGRTQLDYHSSYEGTTATFSAEFQHEYSQSKDNFLHELFPDSLYGLTDLIFDLDQPAHIVATWSCDGHFGTPNYYPAHVRLLHDGQSVFQSTTDQVAGCTFEGDLPEGRYLFRAETGIFPGSTGVPDVTPRWNVDWKQLSAAMSASYSMVLTFAEPEGGLP